MSRLIERQSKSLHWIISYNNHKPLRSICLLLSIHCLRLYGEIDRFVDIQVELPLSAFSSSLRHQMKFWRSLKSAFSLITSKLIFHNFPIVLLLKKPTSNASMKSENVYEARIVWFIDCPLNIICSDISWYPGS